MSLSKIQSKLLEKLKILKKVLDDNKIEYSLEAGSVIGAVREKGFLPWDDDLDLVIPEEMEAKFIKAIESTSGMSLSNYKNKSMNSFYKVYFEDFVKNGKQKSWLKIDVFTIYKEREFSFFQNLSRVIAIGLIDFKSYAPTRYFANCIIPVSKKWLRKKARASIVKGKIVSSKIGYLYDDINYWHANKANKYYYRKYEIAQFEDIKIKIPFKARETMMDNYGDILIAPEKDEIEVHGTKLI